MGDPEERPDERPETLQTIGPPDDGREATQEFGFEEAENLGDPAISQADPAVNEASS